MCKEPDNRSPAGTAYLLHFDRPYPNGGARHYIGWTADLPARLERHASGDGARLLRALVRAGIGWRVVRTWPDVTRADERRLKRRHQAARLCPCCRPQALARHAAGERKRRKMTVAPRDDSVPA